MAIGTPVAGTLAENASSATSLAVPYPADILAGHLLLLLVSVSISTPPNNPALFTTILSGSSGDGTQSPALRWSYKIADGTESGTRSVSMSTSTSKGMMWRISGVDQDNPIDVVGTHAFADIGGSYVNAGLSPTMQGCQVWTSAVRNSAALSWAQITNPFTMTEALDDPSPLPTTQASWRLREEATPTGVIVFDSNTTVRGAFDAFALRPASAPFVPSAFTRPAALRHRRP